MPVLPPTAASTMPASVVGTCTTRTPRSQAAATQPARSVVAPPPRPTIASERVKPAAPSASQQRAGDRQRLGLLAVGQLDGSGREPGATQVVAPAAPVGAQRRRVHDRDARPRRRAAPAQLAEQAVPDQHRGTALCPPTSIASGVTGAGLPSSAAAAATSAAT